MIMVQTRKFISPRGQLGSTSIGHCSGGCRLGGFGGGMTGGGRSSSPTAPIQALRSGDYPKEVLDRRDRYRTPYYLTKVSMIALSFMPVS